MKAKKIRIERDNETVRVFNDDSELLAILAFKKNTKLIYCSKCTIGNYNCCREPFLCEICIEVDVKNYIPDLEKMGITEKELIHLLSGKVIKKKARNKNGIGFTSRGTETR